jgi:large subunit ribosomal protein L10
LAITKERKIEIMAEYAEWLKKSRAMIVAEYKGLPMAELDVLRSRMRDAGGEFHVIKNTLGKLVLSEAGLDIPEDLLEGSTAIGFAFDDPPAVAKMFTEYTRTSEFLKIKGGYLGARAMSPEEVKALADLPPLPVLRARLLGALQAPAAQLARTLAEPARQIAAVFKAYADREANAQPAAPDATETAVAA